MVAAKSQKGTANSQKGTPKRRKGNINSYKLNANSQIGILSFQTGTRRPEKDSHRSLEAWV